MSGASRLVWCYMMINICRIQETQSERIRRFYLFIYFPVGGWDSAASWCEWTAAAATRADGNSEWYTDIWWWSRIMPCSLLTPDYSCASLSRFILRTVSLNCLLNEGKSSLIRGSLHLGYVWVCVCGRGHRQFKDVDMGTKSILHQRVKK